MGLNYKVTVQPTVEPVTLTQAKLHLRVDFDDDDALIAAYITAARQYAENYTQRAFFNQTVQLTLDHFPYPRVWSGTLPTRARHDNYWLGFYDSLAIRLPLPSAVSITSITYQDQDNQTQTLDASGYLADLNGEPGRIVPAFGSFWPYTQLYIPGSVKVTYVAGSYGDGTTVNNCPQTIQLAMLLLISTWYENRADVQVSSGLNVAQLPIAVKALLDTEKLEVFSYGNN